ncbi:hypothetical protein [Mycolicibacterium goodii]|uniref:hypothetical protein n=1 Tax=Mycolicibacterium goodii TaxID=134601 RepID=UPI001C20E471|nr:hypothetical protein [Mycolicibacterium goodii]
MWFRKHPGLNRKVLVSLYSGSAVAGVLVSARAPWLTIKGATVFEADAQPVEADGEILVHESNVDYMQIVGGE